MVFRGIGETTDSSSSSTLSSDSVEDDLEYLIDDLLDKLVVRSSGSHRMTIKNKNRKERPKHERQERPTEVDAGSTPKDDSYPFGMPRYGYAASEDRNQASARGPNRTSWAHTSAASGGLQGETFAYSNFPQPDSSRFIPSQNYGQTSLKRHWPPSLDQQKKACDERLNEEHLDSDDATGNNSEDEYNQLPDKSAQTSKVFYFNWPSFS